MRVPMRQYMALLGITIAAFIFNTSEFIPIALLIDISESFSMTEAAAGQMITIYAWVVALLSLPLMLLTCRMELKRLLLLMVALFGIGQLVSGLASSYDMLLGARIIVACAHSIFWSIAAPLATRLVTREHRPMALSMIVTGSSRPCSQETSRPRTAHRDSCSAAHVEATSPPRGLMVPSPVTTAMRGSSSSPPSGETERNSRARDAEIAADRPISDLLLDHEIDQCAHRRQGGDRGVVQGHAEALLDLGRDREQTQGVDVEVVRES